MDNNNTDKQSSDSLINQANINSDAATANPSLKNQPTAAAQSQSKGRILVVDDEHEVAKVFARSLERIGYQTAFAFSANDAMKCMENQRFHVMLTDINMPHARGDELLRIALKADPDLAVLMITAVQDVTSAVECLKNGAYDYMVKPVPMADLYARIEKAIERRNIILENRRYKTQLERKVHEQTEQIRRMYQNSLEALIEILEAKEEGMRNHSSRVAEISCSIAKRLRPKDAKFIAQVRIGAMFHDIGTVCVPEAIMYKHGILTSDEMDEVKRHTTIGESILKPIFGESIMISIIRYHHERYDGKGYPDGLVGENIPICARIVAVADSYDAMISSRPHRPGRPIDQVIQILKDGSGTQWDPVVVDAFLPMITNAAV